MTCDFDVPATAIPQARIHKSNRNVNLSDFCWLSRLNLAQVINVPFGTADVMNIQNFIGVSSAILLAWLGATYLHKVPTERYPKQGRSSSPITGQSEDTSGKMIADNVSDIPVKP